MTTDITPPTANGFEPPRPVRRKITRRQVLKAIGIGGATVVLASTSVVTYRAFDNGVFDSGEGNPYDPWSQWRSDATPVGAVAAAILAANPHNTQSWLFHVTDGAIEMYADSSRSMPAVDPFEREQHVGLGCALENLTLGLAARGFTSSVTLVPRPGDRSHVATVAFAPATGLASTDAALYDVIGDRHSNRGPYRSEAVDDLVLRGLTRGATGFPGVDLQWLTSDSDKARLSPVMIAATEAFIADEGQSSEAYSWFRNDRDDIDAHRDGPTLDAQGLSPIKLSLAKILPATSRSAGDRFWLEQTRTVHTATAAAYGIITVADSDDVVTRLDAGRLLQRIHLGATAAGLGLQHMNQITEQIDRERTQGRMGGFAARLQPIIAQSGRVPLVAFRVGHPERPALRSPRRPVGSVTR